MLLVTRHTSGVARGQKDWAEHPGIARNPPLLGERLSLSAGYSGRFRSGDTQNGGMLGLRMRFP